MGSIASMPVLPEDHCASQYNVGTLDTVGVAIVWFTVLRWITFVTFSDDLNILLHLQNRKRLGTETPTGWIHLILLLASPIYTIVQSAYCGDDPYMKLNITMMVFLIIYEQIFSLAKGHLCFEFLGHCCGITFPDIIVTAAGAVAITAKDQWRALGITTIVLVCLLSNSVVSRPNVEGNTIYFFGAASLKFTVLYPTILAAFITMLANAHGGQDGGGIWIPRPETAVEYVMLIIRCVAGFGGIDVLAAIVSIIYRLIVKDVAGKERQAVVPGFNWYSIRVDEMFGGGG